MKDIQKLKTDVVVIGSGPGGSTVARDLSLQGKDVIILERGSDNKPSSSILSMPGYLGGLRNMRQGYMLSRELTIMIRCLTTGGSTMMFCGTAWDPPFNMFKKYGINLSKETNEIKKELTVQPVPDDIIGPRSKLIAQSARDLGFKWENINKFLRVDNCKPNCDGCTFGCKWGGKWHARDWAIDAVKTGKATLMNNVYCDEIIVENKIATGVKATGRGGKKYEISANAVVVAAGGVGSPIILMKSGLFEAGRKFFTDPFVLSFGYLEKGLKPGREFPMVSGTYLKKEGIVFTDMITPTLPNLIQALTGFKVSKALKNLRSKKVLIVMAKIRDEMAGSISITEGISKPFTRDDLHKLNIGRAVSRKILLNAGADDIWHAVPGAAHPGGTCSIGTLVDKNLQTQYKNLYVSDASVIPDEWGLPPVLTIVSLARRLSKHLTSKV